MNNLTKDGVPEQGENIQGDCSTKDWEKFRRDVHNGLPFEDMFQKHRQCFVAYLKDEIKHNSLLKVFAQRHTKRASTIASDAEKFTPAIEKRLKDIQIKIVELHNNTDRVNKGVKIETPSTNEDAFFAWMRLIWDRHTRQLAEGPLATNSFNKDVANVQFYKSLTDFERRVDELIPSLEEEREESRSVKERQPINQPVYI